MARGDATPASDIELLVDFDPARRGLDLFAFARELAGMLGRRVDVGTEVHSIIRDKVDALDLAHIDEAATRPVLSSVRWWTWPALPVNSPTCRVRSSSRRRRQV